MSRYAKLLILIGALLAPSAAWAQVPTTMTENELIAELQRPDASVFEKQIACKRLAAIGTEKAVPALAKMLDGDETLAHLARYGLETIPSPQVDQVLAAALTSTKGRVLIGVINSIANRGKPAAIDGLAKKLDDPDRAVAQAAAHAIARLGTLRAVEVLAAHATPEFGPALLVCANTLVKQGEATTAEKQLIQLTQIDGAAKHVRLAAAIQVVGLQGEHSEQMLVDGFKSADPEIVAAALRAARLPGVKNAGAAALAVLPDVGPVTRARLVTLLGDLRDPGGLAAITTAAKSQDEFVRVAAMAALAAVGNADHVPLLVDAAMASSTRVADQALQSLGALKGAAIDQAVLKLLDDPARRRVAVRLVGSRRITAGVPRLLPLLQDDLTIDVLAALGETVALDQLDAIAKYLGAETDETRAAAETALHAACYRMPDRDATAKKLAAYMDGAEQPTVKFLMNELRVLGGRQALEVVASAATGNDSVRREYATEMLGGWLDTSAAPVLLELAKKEGTGKYGIRGLRGYIRLIRQFSMPDDKRLQMAQTAMSVAQRAAEQKLVIEALERYPTIATLRFVVTASKDPALQETANGVAMAMVQKIRPRSRETRALLGQLGQKPVKLEVLRAQYGAGSTWKDVTAVVRKYARNLPLIVLPSGGYNAAFGGDPVAGTPKVLKIEYRINGVDGKVTLRENETVLLPQPK